MIVVAIHECGRDPSQLRLIGSAAIARNSELASSANYVAVVRDGYQGVRPLWIVGHRRRLGFWPLVERVAHHAADDDVSVPEATKEAAASLERWLDNCPPDAPYHPRRPSAGGS